LSLRLIIFIFSMMPISRRHFAADFGRFASLMLPRVMRSKQRRRAETRKRAERNSKTLIITPFSTPPFSYRLIILFSLFRRAIHTPADAFFAIFSLFSLFAIRH
jgi:hypothetical protein